MARCVAPGWQRAGGTRGGWRPINVVVTKTGAAVAERITLLGGRGSPGREGGGGADRDAGLAGRRPVGRGMVVPNGHVAVLGRYTPDRSGSAQHTPTMSQVARAMSVPFGSKPPQ